jgi:hypothetical protein
VVAAAETTNPTEGRGEPTPPDEQVAADSTEVLAALRVPAESTAPDEAAAAAAAAAAAKAASADAPAATSPTGSGPAASPPDTVRIPAGATTPPGRLAGRIVALVLVIGLLGYLGWWYTQRSADQDGNASPTTTTTSQATSDAPAVVSQQITVPGNKAWTGTGVACEPGKSVQLVASGTVFHDPTDGVGPDGSTNTALREFNLPGLPDANHGALVASLDAKAPFTVVGGSATYTCAATGELFLGPNDSGVDNNHGEWTVTVTPSG